MPEKTIELINSSGILTEWSESFPEEKYFQKSSESETFSLPSGSEIFATQQKITPWMSGEIEKKQTESGK